jgi:Zn ribbon nucleic-acid-binding protein
MAASAWRGAAGAASLQIWARIERKLCGVLSKRKRLAAAGAKLARGARMACAEIWRENGGARNRCGKGGYQAGCAYEEKPSADVGRRRRKNSESGYSIFC